MPPPRLSRLHDRFRRRHPVGTKRNAGAPRGERGTPGVLLPAAVGYVTSWSAACTCSV